MTKHCLQCFASKTLHSLKAVHLNLPIATISLFEFKFYDKCTSTLFFIFFISDFHLYILFWFFSGFPLGQIPFAQICSSFILYCSLALFDDMSPKSRTESRVLDFRGFLSFCFQPITVYRRSLHSIYIL